MIILISNPAFRLPLANKCVELCDKIIGYVQLTVMMNQINFALFSCVDCTATIVICFWTIVLCCNASFVN